MPIDNAEFMSEVALKQKIEASENKRQENKKITEEVFRAERGEFSQKVTIDDFNILKVLGRGAFGKVMLVEKKDSKKVYALKSLRKEQIIGKDQVAHTRTERYILEKSRSPFLVSLEYAFQTPEKIFFVMQFLRGSEMIYHLKKAKRFDENKTRFYAAEIVLASEYLHSLEVVYRDLKPEIILLDDDGHICLTDFGMAKILEPGQLTKSFVGTPEYLAPEIMEGKGHGKTVDWWSLGILIYEMMLGLPPFYTRDQNQHVVFKLLKEKEVTFGSKFTSSAEGKDLILKLLRKRSGERLGSKVAAEIKSHPWFKNIH
jgi:serum/glucocorticoid-regulated kinase 2